MTIATIPLTIRVQSTYITGDFFNRTIDVTVPPPTPGADLDEWATDELLTYTGEGDQYSGVEAIYQATVVASPARPDLIGITASEQG